jgi:hypothetical protein
MALESHVSRQFHHFLVVNNIIEYHVEEGIGIALTNPYTVYPWNNSVMLQHDWTSALLE